MTAPQFLTVGDDTISLNDITPKGDDGAKYIGKVTLMAYADGGTAADVPEPTSGLLLLLGVANLALRRRKA